MNLVLISEEFTYILVRGKINLAFYYFNLFFNTREKSVSRKQNLKNNSDHYNFYESKLNKRFIKYLMFKKEIMFRNFHYLY